MKNELVLISLGVALFGVLCIAGNLTQIPTEAGIAKIKEVVNDNVDIINDGVLTNGSLVITTLATLPTATTVDSTTPVVSIKTSGLLVLNKGVIAASALLTNTVTFATAFSDTPVVTFAFTEDPGDLQDAYVGTITSNGFVVTVPATNLTMNWIAVGTK